MEDNEIYKLAKAAKDGKIEVTILKGEAPKFLEPIKPIEKRKLELSGSIGTISEFLKKRNHLFKPDECHIQVDDKDMSFKGNECQADNKHVTYVGASLEVSKELQGFEINSEYEFEPKELAKYLRRRKNFFTDSESFKTIWGALSQFEAEIDKQVKSKDDKTGNFEAGIKQTVTHNVPKIFTLSFPVFKNSPPIKFEVEIDINAHNLRCSLMSFDLDEKIELQRKALIDNELDTEISEGMKLRDFCVVYFC